MAAFVYKNGVEIQSGVVEIVADARTDIDELETNYMPGSSCLVTADNSKWILSPSKEWTELNSN